jgi:hypothetical protein
MDFQLHQYPATSHHVDIVIIANYAPDEVAAFNYCKAWNNVCIGQWNVPYDYGFFTDHKSLTIRNVTFRHLVQPGFLIKNLKSNYGDYFLNSFPNHGQIAIEQSFISIAAAYRRVIHHQQEAERDAWFTHQLQLGHHGNTQVFYHDQKYLPPR